MISSPEEIVVVSSPGSSKLNSLSGQKKAGGLLFSENEILGFNKIANECGHPIGSRNNLRKKPKKAKL
jgi:hypothetical protein